MEQNPMPQNLTNQTEARWRYLFVILAILLFLIFIGGLFWIFTVFKGSPIGLGWFLFSFAAGLSMIVLPCTLPLAFVIVPLSMGKGYVKGFLIALSFGLGVAITLSFYGVLAAILGKAILGAAAGIEVVKNIFYVIAGIFAIIFSLGELGFLKIRLPSYTGAAPGFIQRKNDILKALLLGLFLGNIGIGCPHPATPIILGQIGIVGNVFYGWLLFFIHAIGRIIPLLLLAVLGILGINATKGLLKHKDAIGRATAWGMVFVGAFLFTLGFFSHDWWVASGTHSLLEVVTQEERIIDILGQRLGAGRGHAHGFEEIIGKAGFFGLPLWLGNWVFVALMVIPIWWHWRREKKRVAILPEPEKINENKVLLWKKWFFVALTVLLAVLFIWAIPLWFRHQADEHKEMIDNHVGRIENK